MSYELSATSESTLKTLKCISCHDAISIFKYREDLRQAAISWIKFMREVLVILEQKEKHLLDQAALVREDVVGYTLDKTLQDADDIDSQIKWIKYFFNLSESDLNIVEIKTTTSGDTLVDEGGALQ